MGKSQAEQAADKALARLLPSHSIDSIDRIDLPVDVMAIAKAYGIEVRLQPMEDTVSGLLLLREDQPVIGVNAAHHPHRQRFSIAHELGHFVLHRRAAPVFIDAPPVFYRNTLSAEGTVIQEIEANAFAAELLMPETILRENVQWEPVDVFDDGTLRRLADRFGVSVQALTVRLLVLGIVTS